MRIIKALFALVALAAVIIGPPVALVRFIGNPIPAEGLSWTAPLTDGAIIGLLAVLVWILWAQLMLCITRELIAAVTADSIEWGWTTPVTFGAQQVFARRLVTAVVTGAIAIPVFTSTAAPAFAAQHTTSTTTVASQTPTVTEQATSPEVTREVVPTTESHRSSSTKTVTVVRLDSLYAIAERHLGDGARWTEIARLNEGKTMADGTVFSSANNIRPGWKLLIPGPNTDTAATPSNHDSVDDVEPGDTLWGMAEEHLGDGTRYPELFEASRSLDQPVPLEDPDEIYPGQHIAIPAEASADSTPPDVGESPATPRSSAAAATGDVGSGSSLSRPDIAQDATQTPAADPAPAVSASPDGDVVSGSAAGPAEAAGDDSALPGWLLPAFATGGALLAGAALIGVRQRRTAAGRTRRPGRVPAPTPPLAVDAERSIVFAGASTAEFVEQLDLLLKRLSDAVRSAGTDLPTLVAIEVTDAAIGLHLRAAAEPPAPWITTDDELVWVIDRAIDPETLEDLHGQEPWPLLVTVGTDENGATWLLNLEGVILSVSGDHTRGQDFARYLAAEIACNPWSLWTDLDLIGFGHELAPIAPARIHHHAASAEAAASATAEVIKTMDWLAQTGDENVPAGRCRDEEPEAWPARMLILDAASGGPDVEGLSELVVAHGQRTATALVVTDDDGPGLRIVIDDRGRLVAPSLGLVLTAVAMTHSEAEAVSLLLTHLDAAADLSPADLESTEPGAAYATVTGTLRDEHTAARHASMIEDSVTLLPEPDETYVAAAATTATDLAVLAPKVPLRIAEQVQAADPHLDDDLEQWRASHCDRPRLSILGAPTVKATGTLESRRAFHTALFAYLWSRPQGATREEVAAAMGLRDGSQAGKHVGVLRSWLGATHVPDARKSPAGQARGIGAYEVLDVLVDLALFRRLRERALTRGSGGIADLETALSLVRGEPLSGTDPRHWTWALEGSRLDHEAVVAIVDVAHTVVTAKLAAGDTAAARTAVAVALKAGPYEEIARLDLAAVLSAEGHDQQAAQVIRDEIVHRVDDGDVPDDIPARTDEILEGQRRRKKAV